MVVNVADLVEQNLLRASLLRHRGVELILFGKADGREALLEVARYGSAFPDEPDWWAALGGAHMVERKRRFDVYGQPWELHARSREPASLHAGSIALLVLGLAFTLALTSYVQASVSRRRRVEQLVDLRTADLRRASDSMRLYFRAIESSANAVILVDARGEGYPIEYVNPAFERMRGYRADELAGKPIEDLIDGLREQAAVYELQNSMRQEREGHALLRLRRKDGSELFAEVYVAPVLGERGQVEHFVITEYDVTTTKQYEAQLEHRARYDTLTGLPNRVLLGDRIERAIAYAREHGQALWVVALDLDQFKYVNDSLGHPAGDRLLKQAGQRICTAVGPADTAARTGGDEFVLLLVDRAGADQAAATVADVLHAVAQPFEEHGQRIHVGCSAGIASFPADGDDAETLVKHAEIAMYGAKEAGRNTFRFYLPGMNERVQDRLALAEALRDALDAGQFELHYQPQLALASGQVAGMEALIRWRHPQLGMMRPDRFIAVAEDTGLIVPIGAWVLRCACQQAAAWQRAGHGPLRVAVNLSSHQFQEAGLVGLIRAVLGETGLQARCLELEITESLVMDDVEQAIATMRELKEMGVQLAIDDFGTGYSSLAYLKRFPVDVLKIDRSFVHDIETDAGSAAMVAAIVSLSHDLGMRVIAEGVETAPQREFLRERGCDEIQGYLFSRPLPASGFERLLQELAMGA
ncbi:putative bifunctional diguanylate cyclase/phosphodiesterase [Massilia sp.]|uniref:putative bifunctional diguanylate cyclase/phosphodiesterase n=1 Tax=Massilia sp. TaxID=1882437 RepID=UPI0028B21179|nr:EAL domain-containing protein [Massilia sp.]